MTTSYPLRQPQAAVNRVCFGRNRIESKKWAKSRPHYGFERSTHPRPRLDELNARYAKIALTDENRVLHEQRVIVQFKFREEAELLRPVPFEVFDCGVTLTPNVRREARIIVRQSQYSISARFIGR